MAAYLGKKISLISKAGIRYEGILYTIDPTDSTVALSKVKSFGTEERSSERFIPAREEIYEYIIFRGSDISDLQVCDNSLYTEDSAIVRIVSPTQNAQNSQDKGDNSSFPSNPHSDAKPVTSPYKHSNDTHDDKEYGGSSTRNLNESQNDEEFENIAKKEYHQFMNRDITSSQHRYQRHGFNNNRGHNRGYHNRNNYYESGPFGLPSSRSHHESKSQSNAIPNEAIKDDFDFESSNALLAEELASININDSGKEVNDLTIDLKSDLGLNGCDDTNKAYYDKTRSFFDNISSDRQQNQNEKWGDRNINTETFGEGERRPNYRGRYMNNRARGGNSRGRGGNSGFYNNNYRSGNNMGFERRGNFANRGSNDWRFDNNRSRNFGEASGGNYRGAGGYNNNRSRYNNYNTNNNNVTDNITLCQDAET